MENIKLSTSSPALSLLLYENANCSNNQEGFLLGQIVITNKRSITDNDVPQVTTEKVIVLNSIVPSPVLHYFYDDRGIVLKDKVNDLLQSQPDKVIGWYKYRGHDITWNLTLKDKIVHKQLSTLFDTPEDLFVICQLSQKGNATHSTLSYRQIFKRYYMHSFVPIPMHIVNMEDSKSSYQTSLPTTEAFRNILSVLDIDIRRTEGVDAITQIEQSLESHLENLVVEVSQSENEISNLEKEIEVIRSQLKKKLLGEKNKASEKSMSTEKSIPIEKSMSTEKIIPTEKSIPIEKSIPTEKSIPIEKNKPIERNIPIEREIPIEKDIPMEKNKPTEKSKTASRKRR